MLRAIPVALTLLASGCIFSEFDYGCPDKLMVYGARVEQALHGPWDLGRAWQAFNNTTKWAFAYVDADQLNSSITPSRYSEVVFGNMSDGTGGNVVWVGHDLDAASANRTLLMMIIDSAVCIPVDGVEQETEREKTRNAAEWTMVRDRFVQDMGMTPAAPERWWLNICENKAC